MQYKVPQNITMEDKIVGPLTAIQFGIVIVGGGIAFSIFSSTAIPDPLNKVLAVFVGLFTVIVSVGKFNDQPIYRFMRFFIAYILTPKIRVWHKGGQGVTLVKPTEKKASDTEHKVIKTVRRSELGKLAELVDTGGVSGYAPKIHPQEAAEIKSKK